MITAAGSASRIVADTPRAMRLAREMTVEQLEAAAHEEQRMFDRMFYGRVLKMFVSIMVIGIIDLLFVMKLSLYWSAFFLMAGIIVPLGYCVGFLRAFNGGACSQLTFELAIEMRKDRDAAK